MPSKGPRRPQVGVYRGEVKGQPGIGEGSRGQARIMGPRLLGKSSEARESLPPSLRCPPSFPLVTVQVKKPRVLSPPGVLCTQAASQQEKTKPSLRGSVERTSWTQARTPPGCEELGWHA